MAFLILPHTVTSETPHNIEQKFVLTGKIMEDFKRFVFEPWERCSGLVLSATHRAFPNVAWATFFCSHFLSLFYNAVFNGNASTNPFQVSCSFEKYYCIICKCFSQIFIYPKNEPVFFHDLENVWVRSFVRH